MREYKTFCIRLKHIKYINIQVISSTVNAVDTCKQAGLFSTKIPSQCGPWQFPKEFGDTTWLFFFNKTIKETILPSVGDSV